MQIFGNYRIDINIHMNLKYGMHYCVNIYMKILHGNFTSVQIKFLNNPIRLLLLNSSYY